MRPRVFADAGYRDGDAGLGIWIPAIGTGVALLARASDNNDAETLAIWLGMAVARLMYMESIVVLSDSMANVAKFSAHLDSEAHRLEWRPREETSLADFFAGIALSGRSLIATTASGRNPADKFRPLAKLPFRSKESIKDVGVKWLFVPNPPKTPFDSAQAGFEELVPGIQNILGSKIPLPEFRMLVEEFNRRSKRAIAPKRM